MSLLCSITAQRNALLGWVYESKRRNDVTGGDVRTVIYEIWNDGLVVAVSRGDARYSSTARKKGLCPKLGENRRRSAQIVRRQVCGFAVVELILSAVFNGTTDAKWTDA
jgi:hypothetical protein